MAGIAAIAKQLGYRVSGSDRQYYSPMREQLQALNIECHQGLQDLPSADCYVIGNILSRGMAITEQLLACQKPYYSAPAWLYQQVLQHKKVIAVAGTHGKTTTTAMVTWILHYCKQPVSYLIAGSANNFATSCYLNNNESGWFVIEADEYDTAFFDKRSKFIHYHPELLLINNLEFDHADIFANLAQIEQQFNWLLRTMPAAAQVFYHAHDTAVQKLLQQGCWSRQMPIVAENFDIEMLTEALRSSGLQGQHNRANAMAAMSLVQQAGISQQQAIEALGQFLGVQRRQQIIGQWQLTATQGRQKQVKLISDFAHHPTAIEATLTSLKEQYANATLLVLFDVGSNSIRQGVFNDRLPRALSHADQLFMLQPQHWSAEQVFAHLTSTQLHIFREQQPLLQQLMSTLVRLSGVDEILIVILSNTGFNEITTPICANLTKLARL